MHDWWPDERLHAGREHFDEEHARRYDAKMDAEAAAEVRLLQEAGALGADSVVVDLGAGSGQFTTAVAPHCARVVAVDVSPIMLGVLREKLERAGVANAAAVDGGFLTYEHSGESPGLVYSRLALHHLPDFWQAIALTRIAEMLRPGGFFRLSDVIYSFEAAEAEAKIEAWIDASMAADVEAGWTRAELAEHVRDENSTFTWLLEPMIERAGFVIADARYSADGMEAQYLCRKR
ncbi:MAG: class I SAM-dependent methyltransferase [Solirubrobacteraceae bacterium]